MLALSRWEGNEDVQLSNLESRAKSESGLTKVLAYGTALADVDAILAPGGTTVKYGNAELNTAIQAFVAAFNAAAALKSSVAIVKTSPAPPNPPVSA